MGKSISAIIILIIINIFFFVIPELLPQTEPELFSTFALFYPENPNFRYWQFLTTMFLHGGFSHILLNMYALWAFGTPLEQMWQKKKFLVFYFLSGIGASIIYTLVNYFQFNSIYNDLINTGLTPSSIHGILELPRNHPNLNSILSEEKLSQLYELFNTPAVGASGAIYGILVAFGFSFPNSKLALIFFPFPIAAKYFIPILISIDLFSGITGFSIFGGGIAHFAHVGGALIGFLLMWYWKKKGNRDYPE